VVFALERADANQVYLCGDFNEWSETNLPMIFLGAGKWEKLVTLAPGRYEYKFIVDGTWIADPAGAPGVLNAFGSTNSVVEVPGRTEAKCNPDPIDKPYETNMKPHPLPIPSALAVLALLATLSGGCDTNYGPTSPDYYPEFYPPYFHPEAVLTNDSPHKSAVLLNGPSVGTIVQASSMHLGEEALAGALKRSVDNTNNIDTTDFGKISICSFSDPRQ
jgi:hypothetical protein